MDSKQFGMFLLGAITGAGTFFVIDLMFLDSPFAFSETTTSEPVVPAMVLNAFEEKLTALNQENRELEEQVAALKARLNESGKAAPETGATLLDPPLNIVTPEILEQQNRERLNRTLRRLQAALNLSPKQQEHVRGLMADQLEDPQGSAHAPFHFETGGTLRDHLDPHLSPDQQTALDVFVKQERINRVDMEANVEMLQLSSTVSLSEEQRERAFQEFVRLARERMESFGAQPAPAFTPEMNGDRLQVLAGILTNEQLEVYRSSLPGEGFHSGE